MVVKRVRNWEVKLHEELAKYESAQFEWGNLDCLHFAFKVNKEISGIDHLSTLALPEYKDRQSAIRILAEKYNGDFLFMIDQILNRTNGRMCRGNVVATHTGDGPALGIWASPIAYFMSYEGLIQVKRKEIICAWES